VLQLDRKSLFGGRGDGAPAKHFFQFVRRKLPKPCAQIFGQRHPEARVQHDPDAFNSALPAHALDCFPKERILV
jgi:hypothetical protein